MKAARKLRVTRTLRRTLEEKQLLRGTGGFPPTILEVRLWEDIKSYNEWRPEHREESYPAAKCCSVGYLYSVNGEALTLAQSFCFDDLSVADLITIPWSVIHDIRFPDFSPSGGHDNPDDVPGIPKEGPTDDQSSPSRSHSKLPPPSSP